MTTDIDDSRVVEAGFFAAAEGTTTTAPPPIDDLGAPAEVFSDPPSGDRMPCIVASRWQTSRYCWNTARPRCGSDPPPTPGARSR